MSPASPFSSPTLRCRTGEASPLDGMGIVHGPGGQREVSGVSQGGGGRDEVWVVVTTSVQERRACRRVAATEISPFSPTPTFWTRVRKIGLR